MESQSEGNSFETHGGGMGQTCDPRVAETGKGTLGIIWLDSLA